MNLGIAQLLRIAYKGAILRWAILNEYTDMARFDDTHELISLGQIQQFPLIIDNVYRQFLQISVKEKIRGQEKTSIGACFGGVFAPGIFNNNASVQECSP